MRTWQNFTHENAHTHIHIQIYVTVNGSASHTLEREIRRPSWHPVNVRTQLQSQLLQTGLGQEAGHSLCTSYSLSELGGRGILPKAVQASVRGVKQIYQQNDLDTERLHNCLLSRVTQSDCETGKLPTWERRSPEGPCAGSR